MQLIMVGRDYTHYASLLTNLIGLVGVISQCPQGWALGRRARVRRNEGQELI
jgi:hypothetical protein